MKGGFPVWIELFVYKDQFFAGYNYVERMIPV